VLFVNKAYVMRTWFLTIALVLAAATAVGCSEKVHVLSLSSDGQYLAPQIGPGLVARPDSPIPDLPMPIGFVIVVDQSRVESRGLSRYVRHVYQGRASMADATRFYRHHAPLQQWRSLGEQTQDGQTVMWYAKGSERLTLQLARRGGIVSVVVWITDRDGG
jgi:hypothetical protein